MTIATLLADLSVQSDRLHALDQAELYTREIRAFHKCLVEDWTVQNTGLILSKAGVNLVNWCVVTTAASAHARTHARTRAREHTHTRTLSLPPSPVDLAF